MIRHASAFALGAVVLVVVALGGARQSAESTRDQQSQSQALELLNRLGADSSTTTAAPAEARYFVLKRSKYLAHSTTDRVGTSLDRESESDKILYDAGEAIRRAYKKSGDIVIEWERLSDGWRGRRVALKGQKPIGMVQVELPLTKAASPPLSPVGFGLLFFGVLLVLGPRIKAPRALGLGLLLGLAGVLAVAYGGNITLWGTAAGVALLYFLVTGDLALRAQRSLHRHRRAYAYMAPAGLALGILVALPVLYGVALGLHEKQGNSYVFVGLRNYIDILSNLSLSDPQSFYYKLVVTVAWTVINIVLHVGIGLFFALLLNDPLLKARGLFRVLLIIPWAVPNYITALIWKGMFHKQFGAINAMIVSVGGEPVSWFQEFGTAFFANVATNTWLGFPFMMVVSLGALASIPADLYEAAVVDGASRWQRFSRITLPLLMPALVPAIIVGAVWTFNMFNIIYLVSEGAPQGATDILVTDAFRWAFERDRYGYAAAYSTLIFAILLAFGAVTNRLTKATKGAFE